MKMIMVIEDDAVQRLVAKRVCSATSGILIPETPDTLKTVHPEDYGLVIVDRHMVPKWKEARDSFLNRLDSSCEVVEWTCSPLPDDELVSRAFGKTIQKTGTGRELLELIHRWIKFGSLSSLQKPTFTKLSTCTY